MSQPSLAPSDAVVALRSLPRRYRAALVVGGEERPDDVAHRPGPSGRSALDELHDAIVAVQTAHRQLDQILQKDDPQLDAVSTDAPRADASVDELLGELAAAAEAMADRVAHVNPSEWKRKGRRADGREVTALDVVAEAVGQSVAHLRAAEDTMAAVSRNAPD